VAVYVAYPAGLPAHGASVASGDLVVRINDISLSGMALPEAVKLVKNSGLTVDLLLKREETSPAKPAPAPTPSFAAERRSSLAQQLQQEKASSVRQISKPLAIPKPQSVLHAWVSDHAMLSLVGHRRTSLRPTHQCYTRTHPHACRTWFFVCYLISCCFYLSVCFIFF
jgi:hypothetical protein